MMLSRLPGLTTVLVCLCFCAPNIAAAQPPAAPAQNKGAGNAAAPQTPAPNKQNPFEAVPQTAEPAKPAQAPGQPALEAPKPAVEVKPEAPENAIEAIEFRGARRVPQDTLRALIATKKGDKFDQE